MWGCLAQGQRAQYSTRNCMQLLDTQPQVLDVARSERRRQLLRQSTNWITPQVRVGLQDCCHEPGKSGTAAVAVQ